jgi:hypothetical protein
MRRLGLISRAITHFHYVTGDEMEALREAVKGGLMR